jgi:hypothetical protein
MNELLALQVKNRNQLNAVANELQNKFGDLFATLIGKKAIKVTPYRTFTAKIKDQVAQIVDLPDGFSIVYDCGGLTRVFASLTKRFDFVGRTYYLRTSIFVCPLDRENVAPFEILPTVRRTDFTVEEIASARERIAELDRELSQLKGLVNDFYP